jgi:hypothetical protein
MTLLVKVWVAAEAAAETKQLATKIACAILFSFINVPFRLFFTGKFFFVQLHFLAWLKNRFRQTLKQS